MLNADFYVPQRALVIVAHPDDIEFGAAGIIARWTDAGAQVTYCIVTDGSAGSNAPDADLAALVTTRQAEQRAAAAVVGVSDVRFLGHQDGVLQPTLELRRELARLIRALRPEVVLTMDPTTVLVDEVGYINHPDHRAAGEAALYAVFPSAGTRPIFPELLAEGYEPHNVHYLYLTVATKPNLVVDVSAVIDRKIESLRLHASQIDAPVLEMVKTWDAANGAEFGIAYAERFRVLKLIDLPGDERPADADGSGEVVEATPAPSPAS
jgi:LmbE family N-acetylglucosaminyl deacetylase